MNTSTAALLLLTAKHPIALRTAFNRDHTPLHAAADANRKAMTVAVMYGFLNGRKAYKSSGVDAAVKAIRSALLASLPPVLLKTYLAGGIVTASKLKVSRAASFRSAKDSTTLRMKFDVPNSRAAQWAKAHATELADDLSKTSRERIKNAVERAHNEGDLRDSYDEILDAIGDDDRADVIARTETMAAANEGQRDAWDQAVEDGLLPEDARRVWIATSDACPICEELDGQETTLDGEYPDDGGDGPPAHPNCRCTEGIAG